MMKRLFTVLLVVLLLFVSCSSDVEEDVVEDGLVNETVQDIVQESVDGLVDEPVEELQEPETVVVIQSEEPNVKIDYDKSDLLIEKGVGSYDFDDSTVLDKDFEGYKFKAYEAHYSFAGTKAVASILFASNKAVDKYNLLTTLLKSEKIVFLNQSEVSFLSSSVYFNPYDNIYMWFSKDKLVLIQYSVGTDLLDEYLDDFPVSELRGLYSQEFTLNLEEDKGVTFYFKDEEYYFELLNVDSANDEFKLMVNNEKGSFADEGTFVIANLLIEVDEVDFNKNEIKLIVKRDVSARTSFDLGLNELVRFEMSGKIHDLKVLNVNENDYSVDVAVNGQTKEFEVGDIKKLSGLEIELQDLLINTLGDTKVTASFEVWSVD
ncbi:MAG: hypothetical protein KKF65_00115 [Nanoarchaeota archaeon]|nr:hypothetical protein [Nanoarchaeota archaeon]MBU1956273.1 hypothetical protein [Patescibacteria group bacterium]